MLTYAGLFDYRVGSSVATLDSSRVLYVLGDREFEDRHVVPNVGHASVIITPGRELIDEICGPGGAAQNAHFKAMSAPKSPNIALLSHRLRSLIPTNDNPLAAEELTIATLQATIERQPPRPRPSRVVDKAKQILHAWGFERISLDDIAREVGVSPVYLTQEFTRTEGIPLYRYQLRLRLDRALLELPDCDNITALALDLGFSSHSHFGALFKSQFGIRPSDFRDEWARRRGIRTRTGR